MEIEKKWIQLIPNWGLIMNQFIAMFENRIQIKKKLTTESCFDSHKILHNALYSVEMQRFCVCSNLNLRRF